MIKSNELFIEEDEDGLVPATSFIPFITSVESLDNRRPTSGNDPNTLAQAPSNILKVYEKNGVFYVYADFLSIVMGWNTPLSFALQIWLRTLNSNQAVRFYINGIQTINSGNANKLPMAHPFINSVLQCSAVTQYVLDTHIRQACAYLAIACEQIIVTPLGAISFDYQSDQYNENRSDNKILVRFREFLFKRAIAAKMLTEEEVVDINLNKPISLSYDMLKDRLGQ
jgi:hypothetical protein